MSKGFLKGMLEFFKRNVKISLSFFDLKVGFMQKTYTFVPDFGNGMYLCEIPLKKICQYLSRLALAKA